MSFFKCKFATLLCITFISFSSAASFEDGRHLKVGMAYSCVTSDESTKLTHIYFDNGRYAIEWAPNPGESVSLVGVGKWRGRTQPGVAQTLMFEENVKIDLPTDTQKIVRRDVEYVSLSRSDQKKLYFLDSNSNALLICEEAPEDNSRMVTISNNWWDATRSIRAAESNRVSEAERKTGADRADQNLRQLLLRSGRTDYAEYVKMSRKDRAERDLGHMMIQLDAMRKSGDRRCILLSENLNRGFNEAMVLYQRAESISQSFAVQDLYRAVSTLALNQSATFKCR